MNKKLKADLLLLLTAFIWGSAFVAQKAGTVLEPFTYNGVRSFIGGLALLPVIFFLAKKEAPEAGTGSAEAARGIDPATYKRNTIVGGIACGIALFVASNLQQFGLYFDVDAGMAGFITTLYVMIVPILGIFIGRMPRPLIWMCVAMGVFGFYLLTMAGTGSGFSLHKGELYVLLCAVAFSVHILVIDHFSPKADGVRLSCIQFFFVGIVSLICMLLFENPSFSTILNVWFPIIYAGVFSSGVAYTLQIVAQKDADPTAASLILSLESVFALLSGMVLLGERMSGIQIIGCVVIFAAVIIAQLPENKKAK